MGNRSNIELLIYIVLLKLKFHKHSVTGVILCVRHIKIYTS